MVFHFHVHVIPYYGGGFRSPRLELSHEEAVEVVNKVTKALRELRPDAYSPRGS